MLVLTRKAGQSIYLEIPAGDHDRKVHVKVTDIRGSIVRLGIEADSTVIVDINEEGSA